MVILKSTEGLIFVEYISVKSPIIDWLELLLRLSSVSMYLTILTIF